MESLKKEIFFKDLLERYPEAMKVFLKWIDDYKERIEWHRLFNGHWIEGIRVPKFHDLPIAMQVGIILQFADEQKIRFTLFNSEAPGASLFQQAPFLIAAYFKHLNDHLIKPEQ